MDSEYIVISINHSTAKECCYWRADNKGYTYNPFFAGRYSKNDIQSHPDYYNDGIANMAVPIIEHDLNYVGVGATFTLKGALAYYTICGKDLKSLTP